MKLIKKERIKSIIFIIFTIFFVKIKSGIVELILTETSNKYSTLVCFGIPDEQCLSLNVDFSSPYIWVNSNISGVYTKSIYNPKSSGSSQKTNIINKLYNISTKTEVKGDIFDDTLVYPQFKLPKTKFLVLDRYEYETYPILEYDGELGLGFFRKKEESFYSFVGQLFNNRIFKNNIFTYHLLTNDTAIIIFGVIPKEMKENYNHLGRCKLNKQKFRYENDLSIINNQFKGEYTKSIWECTSNSIYLSKGNIEQADIYSKINNQTQYKVSFDIQENNIKAPLSFLIFLESTLFEQQKENDNCAIFYDSKKGNFAIKCMKPFKFEHSALNFQFQNWKIEIKTSFNELFIKEPNNDYYYFIVIGSKNESVIKIGRIILKYFTVLYDMDDEFFGLYNKSSIIYLKNNAKEVDYPTELPDFYDPKKYKLGKELGLALIIIIAIIGLLFIFRIVIKRNHFLVSDKISEKVDTTPFVEKSI